MLHHYPILCITAALAGAINAVAGGGTLLTFPALFAALGATANAAVIANATSTVALVPGSIAALWGYRRELRQAGRWAWLLIGPSLAGGLIGSLLVVKLPPESFKMLVPWLILTAAVLFALQPRIGRWIGIGQDRGPASKKAVMGVMIAQFLVSIYGGYFGAGIGILMLTTLAMIGMTDIHRMNAIKSLLATLINGTSLVVFSASCAVNWPIAIAMAASASVGGYLAARTARRMSKSLVRNIVVTIGFSLAAYYFWQQLVGY